MVGLYGLMGLVGLAGEPGAGGWEASSAAIYKGSCQPERFEHPAANENMERLAELVGEESARRKKEQTGYFELSVFSF